MPQNPVFALHPSVDAARLAADFATNGRVHIAPFLRDIDAKRLHDHLRDRRDWRLVLNASDKLFELDEAAEGALGVERTAALDRAVFEAARTGFQFRYRTVRIADEGPARDRADTLLDRFASFLSSPPLVSILSNVIGQPFDFADMQATAYGANHFLTAHDDQVAGKNRLAAYVLGLTPNWRADLGGLLLFHEEGAGVTGFVPAFNTLNLFAVPQPHSVSLVSPAAPTERLSVTGWLRTR